MPQHAFKKASFACVGMAETRSCRYVIFIPAVSARSCKERARRFFDLVDGRVPALLTAHGEIFAAPGAETTQALHEAVDAAAAALAGANAESG